MSFDKIFKDYGAAIETIETAKRKAPVLLRVDSWGLQHLTTLPGVPLETPIEIYGPPHAGKTTLANYLMFEAQRSTKKPALFVDVENKYNYRYAGVCRVRLKDGMFYRAHSVPEKFLFGEEAMELMVRAIRSQKFSSVVLDSVGGMTMKALFEGDIGDANMGLEARKITTFVKKLAVVANGSQTLILCLNQKRDKLGGFGSSEKTPGGWAFEHMAGLRWRIGRGDKIEKQKKVIGYYMNITCHKNSFGEPYRTARIPLIYYKGVYPPIELLLTAEQLGLVVGRYKLNLNGKSVSLGRSIVEASKEIMKYKKELAPIISKELVELERSTKMEVLE